MSLLPPVLARMKALGFKVFVNGDYNLNLFGIRSADIQSGVYNDLLGCAYRIQDQWYVRYWAATCDPGTYYRENPMNVRGTAILQPGQYPGVYAIDKHAGKYDALCQRGGPVRVWRDADKDGELDYNVDEAEGYFGINIHASSSTPYTSDRDRDPETSEVGKWSAGCQVHATTTGFREMMALAQMQFAMHPDWKPFLTYTLLEQWWENE